MVPQMLEEIKRHTASVAIGSARCRQDTCPHCSRPPGKKGFRRVGKRRRIFYVVVQSLVKKIVSFLLRWRCPCCRRSFTDYPPFAVPRRRYITEAIEQRCTRYLEDHTATYRRVVRDGIHACGYDRNEDGTMDERHLVPATVHRWLTWLGEQTEKLSLVLDMVRVLAPRSTIHRQVLPIPARKYRSQKRKEVLQVARRLLHAQAALGAIRLGQTSASDFETAGAEK